MRMHFIPLFPRLLTTPSALKSLPTTIAPGLLRCCSIHLAIPFSNCSHDERFAAQKFWSLQQSDREAQSYIRQGLQRSISEALTTQTTHSRQDNHYIPARAHAQSYQ